jgi:transaldolase
MPPKVAAAGRATLPGTFISRLGTVYPVGINDVGKKSGCEKFWAVDNTVVSFGNVMNSDLPLTGEELIERAHKAGLADMLPILSKEEETMIKDDGKIPVYEHWKNKLAAGSIAPDTLLTLAGLASFTADQNALDDRIGKIIF